MSDCSLSKWLRHDTFGAWWVDESGVVRPATEAPEQFDSFAYQHFGLVKIQISRDGFEVRWNINHVNDCALRKTIKWISSAQDDLHLKLTYYYCGWASEFVSKDTALSRISTIQSYQTFDINSPAFMSRHNISSIPQKSHLLQKCLADWSNPRKHIDQTELPYSSTRFLVFRQSETSHNFSYEHVGMKTPLAHIMGRDWAASTIGAERGGRIYSKPHRKIFNKPYETVMSDMEPRYDQILTAVQGPGADPTWISYHRLLLPLRDKTGQPILISVSEYGNVEFKLTG